MAAAGINSTMDGAHGITTTMVLTEEGTHEMSPHQIPHETEGKFIPMHHDSSNVLNEATEVLHGDDHILSDEVKFLHPATHHVEES